MLFSANDDRFLKDTWGLKIGKALYDIRCKGSYPKRKAALLALGVDF